MQALAFVAFHQGILKDIRVEWLSPLGDTDTCTHHRGEAFHLSDHAHRGQRLAFDCLRDWTARRSVDGSGFLCPFPNLMDIARRSVADAERVVNVSDAG
jgi:hypothetical protein